jgi:hypothetical protein
MQVDLLDICRPPDPRQVIADVHAAGARAVGLYAVNWSIPQCERSASFVLPIRMAGIGVLPIVVPSDHPLSVAAAITKVAAWGIPATYPVAIDLERFSYPPWQWVHEFCQLWPGAGLYCRAGDRGRYDAAQPRFWWLADWGSQDNVPAGWQARQWGSWKSAAGIVYDASRASSDLHFWGQAIPTGGKDMSKRSGLAHGFLAPSIGPDADPKNSQVGVPGCSPGTDWNLVSTGPTGAGSVVLSGSAFDTGLAIGPAKSVTFGVTDPNTHGHEEQFGTMAQLGATGPCTLWIQNASDQGVYYLVHTADEP